MNETIDIKDIKKEKDENKVTYARAGVGMAWDVLLECLKECKNNKK